jgi:hypothetical protein
MPAVVAFLQSALKVYPATSPIVVNRAKCVDAVVPSSDKRAGVSGADIVFYIAASYMDDDTLAYAASCQFDSNSN